MSTISKEEVRQVTTAAQEALETEGLTWIKESALHERAYWMGLLCGLSALAEEEDLKPLVLQILRRTMFKREGDDPFRTSESGVAYDALERAFATFAREGPEGRPGGTEPESDEETGSAALLVSADKVHAVIERAVEQQRRALDEATSLLAEMNSFAEDVVVIRRHRHEVWPAENPETMEHLEQMTPLREKTKLLQAEDELLSRMHTLLRPLERLVRAAAGRNAA